MTSASRCVIQQCLSARLMVKPSNGDIPAEYVQVNRGIVVFICFLKSATLDCIPKITRSVLDVKLSYCEKQEKRLSVLDLPGDVLIIPQATLGGKMKGKMVQYHNNVAKDFGRELYDQFVSRIKEIFEENKRENPNNCFVQNGTYGNLQVLSMDTNGPYTTILEF